ncbi:MAG TPA: hypothetical protein EYN73_01920 [Chromatiaceae bacterium]|jgi:hypothetical protein|nr:hypothetical protein [Chromatiaceae bacterium]HIN81723.1 hypothetical protein [Chromatiales bacterium]HIA07838.1 hypothetical protein [Chromatiaceae bacterium]HIB84470.1 hypothetical protein [Chromatiaceae bacterium]HIO14883.1 hypothetical protein [Chromatiales bacterium]
MERTKDMPLWVFLGLMNIETRKGARTLVMLAVLATVVCLPVSYYLEDWSWLAMMVSMTLWYGLCFRWIENNTGWG